MKYNYYWRKSGLKKPYGDNFLSLIEEYKPKNVLEIGVFCGVTSRNICELLKTNFGSDFRYYGLDLFGSTKTSSVDEIEPKFLENQKFSNPLKTIYYNFIKKENLNVKIILNNHAHYDHIGSEAFLRISILFHFVCIQKMKNC